MDKLKRADDRALELRQLHIRFADEDFIAGDPEVIRERVLHRLPDLARTMIGGRIRRFRTRLVLVRDRIG